jgi:adenylate cyclase
MSRDETREPSSELEPRSGLSHNVIREELNRILASREFHATDRMRDFLRFVVEETLAGRADQLKGYTIATQVFGRDKNFDAQQDPIVRIQAGRLRRALERYYLVAGGHDPVHIDMPKGRYIPYFVAQTAKAGHVKDPAAPAAGSRGKYSPVGPSVAVLPLKNLTADPSQNFFAVGLAEDLVTELARFQDIVVFPCQRTALDTGSTADLEQLTGSTGARFQLGGTVRRDPETMKVSMRLIDAKTGRQIWAGIYKHELEASSLIATQEDIARNVVASIGSEYGIIARRLSTESRKKPPADLETYEAMFRYYSYQIAPTPQMSGECFAALQRAVEKEPEYGPAWSALATLYCQMYTFDVSGFDRPLETALQYARKGVFLEPGSQIGRLILAYASYLSNDLDSFHQEIETALGLNPNSLYTVGSAGYLHVMVGESERGLPLLDRAISANPFYPLWFHTAYFIDHFHRQQYDRALLEIQQYNSVESFWSPLLYVAILGKLGRRAEAKTHIEELMRLKPDFASRAGEILRRSLKFEGIVDELIDGLRRAGLEIEERRALG